MNVNVSSEVVKLAIARAEKNGATVVNEFSRGTRPQDFMGSLQEGDVIKFPASAGEVVILSEGIRNSANQNEYIPMEVKRGEKVISYNVTQSIFDRSVRDLSDNYHYCSGSAVDKVINDYPSLKECAQANPGATVTVKKVERIETLRFKNNPTDPDVKTTRPVYELEWGAPQA